MNSIFKSNQFRQFDNYVDGQGCKVFISVMDRSGAVVASGDLTTGKKGVEIFEKEERRTSLDWIPTNARHKLPARLAEMKTDNIRSSAAEFLGFWRGKKVK